MKKLAIFLSLILYFCCLSKPEKTVSIINLEPKEWETYKEIRLRSLQEYPESFGGSFEEESQYPDEQWQYYLCNALEPHGNIFLFGKQNEQIIGMAGARLEKILKKRHIATIFSVYVIPQAQGNSVARKLLTKIIDELKNRPHIIKANLIVNTKQKSAYNLYSSFGFKIIGILEKEILAKKTYHDFYIMEKFF